VDAGKSFSFPFEDRDWPSKLSVGTLISLVPILNFAWSGYLVGIIRNVMNNSQELLPTWDDLGKKFGEGLILFGASLIYAFPILIAVCLPLGVSASSDLFAGNNNFQDFSQRLLEAGGALLFCMLCVLVVYGLALSILYPAILILFAREGTFASCFKLGEAFRMIGKNPAAFLTAWGLSLVASIGVGLIASFVNLIFSFVPCIGWIVGMVLSFATGTYITAVYAHLFGQFGRIVLEENRLLPIG
jgi:hypothetical protein